MAQSFNKKSEERFCKRFQKSISGLRHASINLYQNFIKAIVNHGFQQSKVDHSNVCHLKMYMHSVAFIYVDNVLLLSNDEGKINEVKEYLQSHFRIKHLGVLKYFLAIKAGRFEEGFFISQGNIHLIFLKTIELKGVSLVIF